MVEDDTVKNVEEGPLLLEELSAVDVLSEDDNAEEVEEALLLAEELCEVEAIPLVGDAVEGVGETLSVDEELSKNDVEAEL